MSSIKEEELQFLSEGELNDVGPGYAVPNTAVNAQPASGGFSFIRKSKNPTVAMFHLLFKTLALLVYIFSGVFTSNFIFVCVICILLLAADFWTVKNVTGRILVGLRWWNYVKADGTNEWMFESLENMSEVNPNDSRIFWWGLYIPVMIWSAIMLLDILKLNLQWLIIVVIALSMHIANIVGYTKCSSDAKQRMKTVMAQGSAGLSMMQTFSQSSAFRSALSGILGGGGGGHSSNQRDDVHSVTV